MKKKITIIQDKDKPVPIEVLAESIKAISDGIKKLRAGPLNEKALVLLIQNAAPSVGYGNPLGKREIMAVLYGIEDLERVYLKPKKGTVTHGI